MYILLFCAIILSAAASNPQLNSTYHGLKVHKVIASWNVADRICRSEGGYLASPINGRILQDMKYLIDASHEYNTYFIGTRARRVPGQYMSMEMPGQYVSIEGTALEDMPVFNMLGRLDPTEGDCLSIDDHKISVVQCWTPLPYMCRFNDTKSENSNECDTEGYEYNAQTKKCYKYYETSKTWLNAEATCVAEGAHLVVVNDKTEAQVLHDIVLRTVGSTVWIWIGLQNSGNGNWKSIDGTPKEQLYMKWFNGHKPTNSRDIYAYLRFDMTLGSYAPNIAQYFICEKRPE